MGAFGQNYPTHSTEWARAEAEKTKPALLKPYCEPKSRRTFGMYLQEKQDLSCNRNESLTGEILYKGHCYVERITQEGHRAPWHRHTDRSELAASSSRRPKNTQHCQAGPLSSSTLAWFTAIHPFDLSSNILAWGDGVSFSAPSTAPFPYTYLVWFLWHDLFINCEVVLHSTHISSQVYLWGYWFTVFLIH